MLAALFSALAALSSAAGAQPIQGIRNANATLCAADTTVTPVKSFARGFTGGWQPVTEQQRTAGTWGQVARLWPRVGGSGTFVVLQLFDEPDTASWSQRVDYCFGADGKVLWVESRYDRPEEDSRIDHYKFNEAGTATDHVVDCLNPKSGVRRAEDEGCKEANAFPVTTKLENFPFFKAKAVPGAP